MRNFRYHYVIVAAIFLVQMSAVGIMVNCYNVLSPSIMAEGYTAAQVQAINLARSWTSLGLGVVIGFIITKLGYRKVTVFGAFMLPLGMALRSVSFSMPVFVATSILQGIGSGCVANVPVTMALNNWFYEKKATASAITYTGSSIGGFIFVQLATRIIATMGWRPANLVLSGIAFVILVPVMLFMLREKPEDKGLRPYGLEPGTEVKKNDKKNEPTGAASMSSGIRFKDYVKTVSFVCMGLTAFLFGFTNMGFQNNMIIYMQNELGHSPAFTSMVYSVVMIVMIFGKLIGGVLYDKAGMTFTNMYNLVTGLASVFLMLMAGTPALAICAGVAFGFRQGLCSLGPPYMTAMVVGRREYSSIYGIIGALFTLGSSIGPVLGAMIFDATGSYHGTWILYGSLMLLLAVTSALAVRTGKGYANIE